jgi:hypothetical protein
MLIPLYQYPDADWVTVLNTAPPGSVVIVNPASGPGRHPDPVVTLGAAALAAHGLAVAGYVPTRYGRVPLARLRADVTDYRRSYHTTGLFLDEVPQDCTRRYRRYYQAAIRAIRGRDASTLVILNPGVVPGACYTGLADIIMVAERSLPGHLATGPVPPGAAAVILHGISARRLAAVLRRVRQVGIGYVYLTDRGASPASNAYNRLPTYFRREAHLLNPTPLADPAIGARRESRIDPGRRRP